MLVHVKPNEGCLHLDGYRLGFNDALLQIEDELIQLRNIRAEYDRSLHLLRDEGVLKHEAKHLSTALRKLIQQFKRTILLAKKDKELTPTTSGTSQPQQE